jgi:hypothetical protein
MKKKDAKKTVVFKMSQNSQLQSTASPTRIPRIDRMEFKPYQPYLKPLRGIPDGKGRKNWWWWRWSLNDIELFKCLQFTVLVTNRYENKMSSPYDDPYETRMHQ